MPLIPNKGIRERPEFEERNFLPCNCAWAILIGLDSFLAGEGHTKVYLLWASY